MPRLIVWAGDTPPSADGELIALWRAFLPSGAPDEWVSIPEEVHRNRIGLRARYLAWLHEVGVRSPSRSSQRTTTPIRPGLAYWWMTIPADLSLAPDSPAYTIVRLMSLADFADRHGASDVVLVGGDRVLADLVSEWASRTGRTFTKTNTPQTPRARGERLRGLRARAYRSVPPLAAARVLVAHLGLPRRAVAPVGTVGGTLVVDYLAHLTPTEDGSFASHYWGTLVDLLETQGRSLSWVHLSAQQASSAVVDRDIERVDRFNGSAASPHSLLHRHVSWRILARSCRDYARVVSFGLRTRSRERVFADARTGASLWPAVQGTFRDQYYGRAAMLNCLWLNTFEGLLSRMPPQRLGIYLMENQPWEMAFQHCWRAAGHGELLGVVHSTALFWDTRLFKDPRDLWSDVPPSPMPWPDSVVVNGPVMAATCIEGGYPPARLAHAEALRFMERPDEVSTGAAEATEEGGAHPFLRVLVLGEYSPEADRHLIDVVRSALGVTSAALDVHVRPHPAGAGPESWLRAGLTLDHHDSIVDALAASDIAVCGAQSSAALDAICSDTPAILVGDATAFISSPAEGMPGAAYVTTAAELSRILRAHDGRVPRAGSTPGEVFTLDASLTRWHGLLGEARTASR